jgi:hypothetical protein
LKPKEKFSENFEVAIIGSTVLIIRELFGALGDLGDEKA